MPTSKIAKICQLHHDMKAYPTSPNLTKPYVKCSYVLYHLTWQGPLANGAMFRLLRTHFRFYYLGLKWIWGVVSGVKGLMGTLGLAVNPTSYPQIHFKPK